ncbi:hypothetical protein BCV69DRAFT_83550 [Microstroma glucosiphilum]|uniref:Uncharacterized protein n=1 Tax=Pseudomicrostroma glucosiphilum TaxID=1684307 RepID=A0A316TZG3_9BASI|nr:hypothetical protein BCV69DRAFT_83550 [Pseudomicrostroma glucosiphilum]PWN18048.1 hypothetical protein BCV69DRAFT_83550 [Pseudomicrostroma glucosiphilum]
MSQYNSWGVTPGQASSASYFGDYSNLPPTSSDYPQNGLQGYSYSSQSPPKNMDFTQPYDQPSPSSSSPSRASRITSWFRSRSGSPGDAGEKRSRSRSRSKTPTEGFVVRSVVKQAGGVNGSNVHGWDAMGAADNDSSYQRSKSRPLTGGMVMSLGVPPGGPGGGTGYGTAHSSNDGRPEQPSYQKELPPMPMASPSSPSRGSFDASSMGGGFAPPLRPASPGVAKAGVFRKPRRLSASPAPSPIPKSPDRAALDRPTSPIGERYTANGYGSVDNGQNDLAANDSGPVAYLHDSTLNPSNSAHDIPGFDPSTFQQGSEGELAHISFTASPLPDHRDFSDPRPAMSASPLRVITNNLNSFTAQNASSASATSPAAGPGLASKLRGFFNNRPLLDGEGDEDNTGAVSDDEQGAAPSRQEATPYGVSSSVLSSPRRGSMQPPFANSPHTQRKMDAADWEAEQLRRQTQMEAVRLIDEERRRAMEDSASSPVRSSQASGPRKAVPAMSRNDDVPSLPSSIAREVADEGWTSDALSQMSESGRRDLVRRLTAKGKARSVRSNQTVVEHQNEWESEEVAREADESEVEIEWDRLTPAQRIIAETRAGTLEMRSTVPQADDHNAELERSRDPRAVSEEPFERHDQSSIAGTVAPMHSVPTAVTSPSKRESRPEAPRLNTQLTSATVTSSKIGISPGNGPLPSQLGLMEGLEEMAVRFYRFERYAVPLLRSLEGRVGDIEKDAMMSSNATTSVARPGEAEMDRWVGEMTRLMKHEIGQLKAAGKELKEARQVLGSLLAIEKDKVQPGAANAIEQAPTAGSRATSPTKRDAHEVTGGMGNLSPPKQEAQGLAQERARSTSPSGGRPKYTSALGRPMVDGRVSASASPERPRPSSITPATSTQHLIALQRAKSTAATVGVETQDGRPVSRQDFVPPPGDASFSIDAAEGDETEADSETQESSAHDASFSIEAAEEEEDEEEEEELPTSQLQTPSEGMFRPQGNTPASLSPNKRDVSVNDRLKGLMQSSRPAPSPQTQAEAPSPVQNNYYADSQSLRSKAPSVSSTHTATTYRASRPVPAATAVSSPPATSLAPPSSSYQHQPIVGGGLLGARTSPSPGGLVSTRNLDGGRQRTSPAGTSPASFPMSTAGGSSHSTSSQHATWSPNTSPRLIPDVRGEDIRIRSGPAPSSATSGTAGPFRGGLQARAQSYLLSASGGESPPLVQQSTLQSPRKGGDNASNFYTRPAAPAGGRENMGMPSTAPLNFGGVGHKSTFTTSILPGPGTGSNAGVNTSARQPGRGMSLKERVAFFEVSANRM